MMSQQSTASSPQPNTARTLADAIMKNTLMRESKYQILNDKGQAPKTSYLWSIIVGLLLLPNLLLAQGGPAPTGQPDTPNAEFEVIDYSNCGKAIITQKSTNEPPTGVIWYWQSQSDGNTYQGPSDPSYTALEAGWYYLRAYNGAADPGFKWSENRQSIEVKASNFKVKPDKPWVPLFDYVDCNKTVLTQSGPPAGTTDEAWYWQADEDGVLRGPSNSASTKEFTSSGVYYTRARNTNGCWSEAQTGSVDVGQDVMSGPPPGEGAPPPAKPVACFTFDHDCGVTTITRTTTPPAGVEWHWQPNTSSHTLGESDPDYEVTGPGIYALRAYDQLNDNWSSSALHVEVKAADFLVKPSTPAAPTVENNCGYADLTRTTQNGSTLYWHADKDNPVIGESSVTLKLTTGNKYYLSAKHNESGCWSGAREVNYNILPKPAPLTSVPYTVDTPAGQCGDKTISLDTESGPGPGPYYHFLGATQSTTNAVPFGTHVIATTDTYYFTDYNGTCHSDPYGIPLVVGVDPENPQPYLKTDPVCGAKKLELDDVTTQYLSFPQATHQPEYLGINASGKHEYEIRHSGNYTVRATATSGCSETADFATYNDIKVTLNPEAYTLYGGGYLTDNPSSYTQVHLRESESDVTYKIFEGSTQVGTITGGGNKKSASLPDGTYTVEAHRTRADDPTQTCMVAQQGTVQVVDASTQFVDRSFTASKAYKVPKKENEIGSVTTSEMIESVTYYDDKGRPVQSIAADAAPDGRDLVQHMAYDALGRQKKSYLPYAADYDRVYHTSSTAAADQTNFYDIEPGVAHDDKPYSEVTFDGSPMNRVTKATGPGTAWNDKGIEAQVLTNSAADDVRHWKITNEELSTNSDYPAGELRKQESTNEDGHQQISFINKEGQVVLTKVQAPNSSWTETYHVYDSYGRLRYTLPPLAMEKFEAPDFGDPEVPYGFHLVQANTNFADVETVSEGRIAFTPTSTVSLNAGDELGERQEIRSYDETVQQNQPVVYYLDELIFQYEYDHRHRLIAKKVPGADWEYIVYDDRDRIVLTQNGNQRANNEWSFIKYDLWNRPIMTGLKKISGSLESIRTTVANSSTFHESFDDQEVGQYTDNSYPTGISIDEVQTVTYYDNYDFTSENFVLPTGVFDATNNQIIPAKTGYEVNGLTTGSWAKISGTTDQFVKTVSYYDEKYRLTQTVTINHKGNTDRMTAQYNWQGQLTKTYVEHGTHTIEQTYTYDHMGRPLTTTHSFDGAAAKTIASYTYNALGQLENKTLADGYEEIDYSYNIRSQLTQINDPGDSEEHLFEMAFKYENATNAKYDGTIGAVDWKNPFETTVNSFDYSYDEQNRLTAADFSHTGSHTRDYGLESISYDANSNITALKRKGDHDDTANQSFDDLSYDYDGNQLMEVTDAASMSTGFDDQVDNKLEFEYDANGNLVQDLNKGITEITYNHLNQPLVVTLSDVDGAGTAGQIEYVYAAGAKVQQKEYRDGALHKTTDYIGGFLYEDDELQLIAHDQGRVVVERDVNGNFVENEYQYYLTDHLGNIRVTFKTEIDVDTYEATMETENDAAESPYFYNLDTRHTHTGSNHTSGGNESSKLDNTELIGPAIALQVLPGDKVDMEVYAYYEGGSGYSNTVTVASFIQALAAVFGGSSGAGGESGLIFDGVDEAVTAGMGGVGGSGNDLVPAAYLSYVLYDQNYKPIQHGYHEISGSADMAQEKLFMDDIAINEPGYLYIYTSMQSDVNLPVYFDDLKVTHTHSPVIQKSDYLPFGLEMQSYTRPAITAQNFKFNSGSEHNETTGWYQTPFRNYDPALGRFHGVDALAPKYSSWTPSHFAGNNPIMYSDPSGLDITPLPGDVKSKSSGPSYTQQNRGYNNGMSALASSGESWVNDIYRGMGDAGIELNARVMSTNTFTNFYNVTDENRESIAHRAGGAPSDEDFKAVAGAFGWMYEGKGNMTWFAWEGTATAGTQTGTAGSPFRITPMTINLGGLVDPEHYDAIASETYFDFWYDNPILSLIPDVITLDVSLGASFPVGGGKSWTLNLITRGSDYGFHTTQTHTGISLTKPDQWRYGLEVDGGINIGGLYYKGDSRDLTANDLLGKTYVTSGGFIVGGNYVEGVDDSGRTILRGISAGVGVTLGLSHGVGQTTGF